MGKQPAVQNAPQATVHKILILIAEYVERTGIEPVFLRCKRSAFPLDERPRAGMAGLEPATSPLNAVIDIGRPIAG